MRHASLSLVVRVPKGVALGYFQACAWFGSRTKLSLVLSHAWFFQARLKKRAWFGKNTSLVLQKHALGLEQRDLTFSCPARKSKILLFACLHKRKILLFACLYKSKILLFACLRKSEILLLWWIYKRKIFVFAG